MKYPNCSRSWWLWYVVYSNLSPHRTELQLIVQLHAVNAINDTHTFPGTQRFPYLMKYASITSMLCRWDCFSSTCKGIYIYRCKKKQKHLICMMPFGCCPIETLIHTTISYPKYMLGLKIVILLIIAWISNALTTHWGWHAINWFCTYCIVPIFAIKQCQDSLIQCSILRAFVSIPIHWIHSSLLWTTETVQHTSAQSISTVSTWLLAGD